jgi:LysM repeat protein
MDEQREPHYLQGQKLARQMDYQGAIDSYEKAVQVNPRSASAHFELALLYEDKVNDPAAAIYHYQSFLKLCSRSDNKIDAAQQHVVSCKVELAKSVASLAPLPPSAQTNMEKLLLENRDLKMQLEKLKDDWRLQRLQGSSNPPPSDPGTQANPPRLTRGPADSEVARSNANPPGAPMAGHLATGGAARTHTVKSGETLAAIARKYGISLNTLQAANPKVEARRLQVGMTLSVPGT